MNDVKLAFRQLVKSPGFGAVAVLSLALGIGANTAIFSLVNEVLLRSLPVRNPGELVLLRTIEGARGRMSRFGENNGFIDPATGRFASTSFSMYILEHLRSQRSARQRLDGDATFAVRIGSRDAGDANEGTMFLAVRTAVREIDPALPVLDLRTEEEQINRLHAQQLLFASLSGSFGMFAIALACVGLYGLISQMVTKRTGEIGLRMALGAAPSRVLRMVLRESVALLCVGIAIGALSAYAAGRVIAAMLFGLSPADPLTFGAAAVILTAVCVVATSVPARRASRIDPMVALKVE